MAFFMPYTVRHSEAPLANFLRLVDDLNTFPGASNSNGCRRYAYRAPRAAPRPWHPRFEARETQDAYVLRGELPGLNRDHVSIEFPESQKIVISGKVVEATQEEPAPAAAPADEESTVTVDHAEDATMAEETESRSSYQATVEDDDEDDDFEVVGESAKKQEKQPLVAEPEPEAKQPEQEQERQPEPAKERVLRQFTRAFTFDAPVEYDFVTASLKDGLLEVVIPKLKHQPHQVIVN